jgi:hypothetical protein
MTLFIEDGEVAGSQKEAGEVLPPIYVQCHDCGNEWRYYWSNAPKWVLGHLESI